MSDILLINLPLDILVNILKNLGLPDIRNVMLTCKSLRNLITKDNYLWRFITKDRLIIRNSLNNSRAVTLSWYNQCRISHNWCRGIYRAKVVISHQTNFMPWMKYYNSKFLVLSVGSELRCYPTDKKGIPSCHEILWSIEVPTVKRHDVRTNDISRFICKDNIIVCGNRDGCFVTYNIDNILCKPYLVEHVKDCHENGLVEVTAVELIRHKDRTFVVTASDCSSKVLFWPRPFQGKDEVEDFKEITVSDGIGVKCLAVNQGNDKLAIGLNGNSKPLLFDVIRGQLLMGASKTKNVKQAVRDISWLNHNTISYVTHSGILQLIDTRSSEVIFDAMDPFQSTLYCLKTDGHNAIVVGSSEYSRCVLFDTRKSSNHIQMYFTQKKSSPIYSLDFDSSKLVAAADRSVAALTFNVNAASAQIRDYSYTFEFCHR